MAHKRRLFGSIERRPGGYRARYVGVDGRRYDAPHLFLTRIDAEGWLSEVHREVLQGTWRPPQRDTGQGSKLEFLSGFARRCIAERDLTPRTREEYKKLLENLILPTLALSVFYIAIYTRMTRAAMLEVSHMGFVKTARAKGLTPGRIRRAHILRNALLPVVTLAGIQAGNMVGGAVLTETVFAWPGIGRLMFEALLQRDYNLLLGTFLFTAAMAIAFNILTDLAYTLVDPSIEMS